MDGVHARIGLLLGQNLAGHTMDLAIARLRPEKDAIADGLLLPYSDWMQLARAARQLSLATISFCGSRLIHKHSFESFHMKRGVSA